MLEVCSSVSSLERGRRGPPPRASVSLPWLLREREECDVCSPLGPSFIAAMPSQRVLRSGGPASPPNAPAPQPQQPLAARDTSLVSTRQGSGAALLEFFEVSVESTLYKALKFLPWRATGEDDTKMAEKSLLTAAILPALSPSEAYVKRLGRVGSGNFTASLETEFKPRSLGKFWDVLYGSGEVRAPCQHWEGFLASLANARDTLLKQDPSQLEFGHGNVHVPTKFDALDQGKLPDPCEPLTPFAHLSIADLCLNSTSPLPGLPLARFTAIMGEANSKDIRGDGSSELRLQAELVLAQMAPCLSVPTSA